MFENSNSHIPKKYFFIIAGFALINILMIIFFFYPYTSGSDQDQYFQTAHFFLGQGDPVASRMLKPFMPFFVAVFSPCFGLESSFIFINSIFYFFVGFIIFKIIKLIFGNDLMAIIGALFYLTAYPMLEYGIAYSTDISGWFFFLVSVYFTLLFLKKPSYGLVALNGLISVVGFSAKESGAMGALFFVICLFFIYKDTLFNKIKFLIIYSLLFLIPFIAWQAFVYLKFQYSYFDWYMYNVKGAGAFKRDFSKIIIKSVVATFLLGWVYVLTGLVTIKKMSSEAKKIILALIPSSFSFLLWFAASSRLYYILGLILSVLAAWGFVRIWNLKRLRYLWVGLFGVALAGNYFWLVFDDRLRIFLTRLLNIHY